MIWTGLWGLPVGIALGWVQLRLWRRFLRPGASFYTLRVAAKLLLSLGVIAAVALCNYWAAVFVAIGYTLLQTALLARNALGEAPKQAPRKKEDE